MADQEKKPSLFRSLFPEEDTKSERQKPESFKGASHATELDVRFAENFSALNGKFVYADNPAIFFKLLRSLKNEKDWNQFFVCDHDINIFMQDNHYENGEVFQKMEDCDVAISYCFGLLADEGVVLLSPHQATNSRLTQFPNEHVIIASTKNLYKNLEEAIDDFTLIYDDKLPSVIELSDKQPLYNANKSRLLNATGASNVYVFFIDEEEY